MKLSIFVCHRSKADNNRTETTLLYAGGKMTAIPWWSRWDFTPSLQWTACLLSHFSISWKVLLVSVYLFACTQVWKGERCGEEEISHHCEEQRAASSFLVRKPGLLNDSDTLSIQTARRLKHLNEKNRPFSKRYLLYPWYVYPGRQTLC